MPFKSEKEVADKVKGTDKLSERKRRQFMHVVNKCIDEKGKDSESCYKQAWGTVNNTASVRVASELVRIAKGLIAEEVPSWVSVDFVNNIDIGGTILKRFNASFQGVPIWALQGKAKIYKDNYGWVSVNWVVSPIRDGSTWKVKSEISFAPATSGSFARRKFEEFKGLSLITGDDDFRMFNAFAKFLLIVPNNEKEDIDGLIRTHGQDLNDAKKFWKMQVKNFDLEGGR